MLIFPILTLDKCPLYAVTTKMWTDTDRLHFSRGKLENVSLLSTGYLTLSPSKRKIKEIPAVYIWCLATNESGLIFAGTGDPGSIYKIKQDGDVTEFFKTTDLHVQTIAIDTTGNIYAGTLPHGIIYKITPDGKGEIFSDLPDPYVWDIIFDGNDSLYAATGHNGIIYKISKDGVPTVFFDSPYSNILDLVIDEDNNIYAACEPEGLIYKITANGDATVLYDTEEDEIHCLAIDKDGILYAGASSGRPPMLPVPMPQTPPGFQPPPPPIGEFPHETYDSMLKDIFSDTNMDDSKRPFKKDDYVEDVMRKKPISAERNSVYKIDKDGRIKEIFTAENSFILCLTIDSNNDVFVGTGNKAKIFKIDNGEDDARLLYDFCESQILDILSYNDECKYIATGNNANLYQLSNGYSNEGIFESVVHDTTYISSWGCISWESHNFSETEIKLSTKTGNSNKPDVTWSDWSQEYQNSGEKIKSPPARFIQYRAILTTTNPSITPILDNVCIAYLPQNQPPIIRSIKITSPRNSTKDKTNTNNNVQISKTLTPSKKNINNFEFPIHEPKKNIYWDASDPNKDRLRFDLQYKSVDENKWKKLQENIKEGKKYHWNTNRIPDGYYQVKVIASDVLDNPIELSLTEEKASYTFLIDNTRPTISNIKKIMMANSPEQHSQERDTLIISGVAKDEMCNIAEIQYSIDSGDWKRVFPVDKIFDSKEEPFQLKIPYISLEEHTIVINAIDAEDNVGSLRVIFNP